MTKNTISSSLFSQDYCVSRWCEGLDDARTMQREQCSVLARHSCTWCRTTPFQNYSFDLCVPHCVHVSVFAWLLKTKLQARANGLPVGMIISMY